MKPIIVLLSIVFLSIFSNSLIATETAENMATEKTVTKNMQNIAVLKSAVIFNIIKYTRWPERYLANGKKIRLGLVGDDTVIKVIKRELANVQVFGHELEIVHLLLQEDSQNSKETDSSGGNFHLIYVADNVSYQKVEQQFASTETLLVGGTEQFADAGGMVSVVYKPSNSRVVIEVNLEALAGQNVSLSSRLLSLATIVGDLEMPLKINSIPDLPIMILPGFMVIDRSWT